MEIIVINGFLGSGKTTLCKRILDELFDYKVAVLVNEFGKASMDDKILLRENTTIEEIHNGSIFCSCKSDKFVDVILKLLKISFDYILIETSGFTNPDSFDRIMSFLREKSNSAFTDVHSITVTDPHTLLRLWNTMPIISKQLEVADVIIVNKMDLCNEEEQSFMNARIKEVQPDAHVLYSEYANVNVNVLLQMVPTHKASILQNHKDTDFSTLLIEVPEQVHGECLSRVLLHLLPKVYRIKGRVKLDSGIYIVQIASGQVSYEDTSYADQRLIVLYSSKQIGKKEILFQFSKIGGIEVLT